MRLSVPPYLGSSDGVAPACGVAVSEGALEVVRFATVVEMAEGEHAARRRAAEARQLGTGQ